MDTSGYFPTLETSDGVDQTVPYSQALADALNGLPLVAVDLTATDQVLGSGTVIERPITWNKRAGTATMNPTGNATRLVAPVAGWYRVEATAVFSNVSGGQRSMGFQVFKNGVKSYSRGQNNLSPSASFYAELNGSLTVYLATNDYVTVTVESQTPAAAVSIKADQGTRAAMTLIRTAA